LPVTGMGGKGAGGGSGWSGKEGAKVEGGGVRWGWRAPAQIARRRRRLTRPKDDGVPDHDVVGAWAARDALWRLGGQALKVANKTALGEGGLVSERSAQARARGKVRVQPSRDGRGRGRGCGSELVAMGALPSHHGQRCVPGVLLAVTTA
jgi:hypothetical protein